MQGSSLVSWLIPESNLHCYIFLYHRTMYLYLEFLHGPNLVQESRQSVDVFFSDIESVMVLDVW